LAYERKRGVFLPVTDCYRIIIIIIKNVLI